MRNPTGRAFRPAWFALLAVCPALWAADVTLPAPQMDGGKPLMQALKARHSTREFAPDKLPLQTLSNLLWAANGENRPGGQRTAPSAVNAQQIDIYVALADGTYLYQAKGHRLQSAFAEDLRKLTGSQAFVAGAPLNLVYVADLSKPNVGAEDRLLWAAAGAGFISQNVYLYCASEGLNTVVRAMMDRDALAKALKLRPDQRILLSQTVGFPVK